MNNVRRALPMIVVLLVVGGCVSIESNVSETTTSESMTSSISEPETNTDSSSSSLYAEGSVVYRIDDELWVDGVALGVDTPGPPRWRPGHPDQVTYFSHSQPRRAGVFLFEQAYLKNLATGEETLLLDIDDHGWEEAGHLDWNQSGTEAVFAAHRDNGNFVPHLLDTTTGEITRVETDVQIIDTVFGPDDRLAGVDTSAAADQFEPVVWVTRDGRVEPIESSTGVNRDPVVSPDGRYMANIRASGPLARIFIGRWDLVITNLEDGTTRIVGDGSDGFGPPRWIDDATMIAKHGRYNQAGIIASIPDVVTVSADSGTFAPVSDIPLGAWDPDPMIGSESG